MPQSEQPRVDCSDVWADRTSNDIAETLARRQPQTAAHITVGSMNGDIINVGGMPPQALAEFLAARRRRSQP